MRTPKQFYVVKEQAGPLTEAEVKTMIATGNMPAEAVVICGEVLPFTSETVVTLGGKRSRKPRTPKALGTPKRKPVEAVK